MIRAMRRSDTDAVADIWLDTNIEAHSFISGDYWSGNLKAVKQMLGEAEVYVYEAQHGIEGFIGLDGDYIAGIFVRSGARSGGIGRLLLDFVKGGRERLRLDVYQRNTRAVKFYLREGFRVQREGTDGRTGEAEYHMHWER